MRANQVNDLLYNVDQSWSQDPFYGWGPLGFVPSAVGTPSPPLAAFLADAGNPDALVERLNRLLLHGTMNPQMRSSIITAMNAINDATVTTRNQKRARTAVYLVATSSQYDIQR